MQYMHISRQKPDSVLCNLEQIVTEVMEVVPVYFCCTGLTLLNYFMRFYLLGYKMYIIWRNTHSNCTALDLRVSGFIMVYGDKFLHFRKRF